MGDPRRGAGFTPEVAHEPEQSTESERTTPEQNALEELSRTLEAIDRGEAPEGNLATKDEYFEFKLDERVAYHYAALLIGGAKHERLKHLADALPFGERQMREALIPALVAKLTGSYYDPEETSYIDWSAIASEDESVFSDERVQSAISSYIDDLIKTKREILKPTAKVNPFDQQKNRRELRNTIGAILDHVPTIADEVFSKMVDSGDGEMACEVIESINITHFKGRLSPELALKLQVEKRNFVRGIVMEFFSGLTLENLKLISPDHALKHVSVFDPSVQNWIVNAYLSGRDQQGWNQEEYDKELSDHLPEMAHLDQSALAMMRLHGFMPDESWAAALPMRGEGIAALLEVLDDPVLPSVIKKSQEFVRAMDAGVVTATLDGKPVSSDLVRAGAFAREKYKVGPSAIFDIVEHDSTFLDQPPDDDRTGSAIIASLRRDAAKEKDYAGGPIAEWGAVDTESSLIAGNTTAQIADRMERFGTTFGWTATLRFANRMELNYHDAFLCVDSLERFASQRSDVTKKDIALMLDQVARDDVKYDGQPSQTQFRLVLDTIGEARIEDVLVRVEKLNIPSLAERVAKLCDDPRFHPYKTWKGMREFASVVDFLNKNKTLEKLADSNAPESTKQFGHALLEHPNVPANEVLKFLTNPSAFLSAEGSYTGSEQSHMAPINLARVERLGLSAAEVRDAIADGSLDRLQVLPAFERVFILDTRGVDPYSPDALQGALLSALGRRERSTEQAPEGQAAAIVPKAREAKKLFAAIQAAFERHGIAQENRKPWLLGEAIMVPAYWTDALAKDLYDAVYDKKIGINAPSTLEVRARIGKKSDPSLIVAGNDTASCMPFGDGKTNVYSWSPSCAQMVVERKMADGSWRTMAQSVVMPTLAGDKPAPERFSRLIYGEKVNGVFEGGEFARPSVILCDNVEPNPNEVQEGRMPIVEAAYRNFFHSYLSEHAQQMGVDPTRVIIGKESYLPQDRLSFPKTPNVFVPLAPISYTDNNATESYVIETGLPSVEVRHDSGVSQATGADIMAMAYMEGKGFQDNEQMVFGLYDRQQRVTAALISREQHGDPALTLISRDNKGEPTGYMLAYVGRTNDVPEVFIDDFAVDRSKNLLAARHAARILDEFLDRYVGHYESRNEPFPSIFAQMREDTSYKLLVRQLQNLSQRSGIQVEMVEEGVSSLGGEPMHLVRIYVGKSEGDIAESKRRWNQRIAKVAETESRSQWGSEDDEQTDTETEGGVWDDGEDW